MKQKVIGVGLPAEVEAFKTRHEPFFGTLESLKKAMELLFLRRLICDKPADAVIFYLGRRCVDDFWEILLLCANGYGAGASALLRGMFERAVTAAYIHIHADTAPDFADYDFVRRWKIAQAIEKTFGISAENADKMAELEASYQSVRARFEITDCKTCNTKRLNHTWSKLDLVAMAGKVGTMGSLVVPAYYLPLAHAHSTLASISARLEEKNGVLTVRDRPDYQEVDRTFHFSHFILLKVLDTQVEHFGSQDFEEAVNAALEDYKRIWFKQDLDEPG